jgi:hypothetical protein
MKRLSHQELARLAPDYPFEHSPASFVFRDGEILSLDAVPWSPAGRIAVVAYGSNRSPSVLRRKYAGRRGVLIPTVRAELKGFDVVYAAFVSTLGPIPATLMPHPGAVAEVAVQFLTPEQLEQMHESERVGVSYGFAELGADDLAIEGIPACPAFFYYSLYGVLCDEGEPVALAEIRCRGRRWRALRQREVQELVRRRLGVSVGADEFLLEVISCERARREHIARLSRDALVYRPVTRSPAAVD